MAIACLLLKERQIGDVPSLVLPLSQIQGRTIGVGNELKPLQELLGGLQRIEGLFDLRDQLQDRIRHAESGRLQPLFGDSLFERNHDDTQKINGSAVVDVGPGGWLVRKSHRQIDLWIRDRCSFDEIRRRKTKFLESRL